MFVERMVNGKSQRWLRG